MIMSNQKQMNKFEKTPPQLIYFCLAGSNHSRFNALIMGLKRKITRKISFALSSCPCHFSPK